MLDILFINNSFAIEVNGLKNATTGTIDEGASVSFILKDANNQNVGGQLWPLILAHQANGRYIGILNNTVEIVENGRYTGHLTVTGSGGEVAFWKRKIQASYRGNKD